MAIKELEDFETTKQDAIDKLTDAYKAVADLIYFSENPELETMCDAILTMRSTIRLTVVDE